MDRPRKKPAVQVGQNPFRRVPPDGLPLFSKKLRQGGNQLLFQPHPHLLSRRLQRSELPGQNHWISGPTAQPLGQTVSCCGLSFRQSAPPHIPRPRRRETSRYARLPHHGPPRTCRRVNVGDSLSSCEEIRTLVHEHPGCTVGNVAGSSRASAGV